MTNPDKKADFSDVQSNVESTEQVRKRADFSDVQSTIGSTEQIDSATAGEERTYTVQKGDTLSHIAKEFYGKLFTWNLEDMPMGPGMTYTTISPGEGTGGGMMRQMIPNAPSSWLAYVTVDDVRQELAGHDLACWCPLDQPCHADVLLELANAPQ